MSFIVKNNGFVCAYCQEKNPPAQQTCRNHCRSCLCSQHVDDDFPGDRASTCGGKMSPKAVLTGGKKSSYIILHQCESCAQERRNISANDDNFETLLHIAKQHIFL